MDKNHLTGGFELHVPSTVQTVFFDNTLSTEIGQDFVLPDYQPEIRKLLRISPIAQPPSRFFGVGEAELGGNVCFTVLYIGGDGGLYSVALNAPYSFRIPVEGDDRISGERPYCLSAELTPQAVSHRLTAPRKLRLSCRLDAHISLLCDRETDLRGEVEADERLEQSCLCARALCATGEAIELTEEIPLGGEGEVRVIAADGAVRITEAVPAEEGVVCRGEVYLKILLIREPMGTGEQEGSAVPRTAELETVSRRLPLEQTLEMPQSVGREGWEAAADGVCTDVAVRVEDGRLLCAVTVITQAWAQGNDRVSFIRDCFSTERPTECRMRQYPYAQALGCINGNVTSGGNTPAEPANIPNGAEVLDLSGCARATGITAERGRAVLTADCLYRLLYRTAEGELGHGEFHLPLRYEMPDSISPSESGMEADVRLQMLGGRVRPNGEDGYAIDAEWSIAGRIYGREQISAVDEVRPLDVETVSAPAAMVICYPSAEDSLWSIAKRYRSSVRALAARNELPGGADAATVESLTGVTFLMME